MKLRCVIDNVRRVLEADVQAGRVAASVVVRRATDDLKSELRAQVENAFQSRRLVGTWRAKLFPRSGRPSLGAAGIVFSKAPSIMDAFERGATIRPTGGRRYLAIPTAFNRQGGRRGARPRVSPAQMVATRQAFVVRLRAREGLAWCLPVRRGTRAGRGRAPLIAGGVVPVATARRKGAARWQARLLEQGFVPMYLLLPTVRLTKRLDVAGAAHRVLRRLPSQFMMEWERQSARHKLH